MEFMLITNNPEVAKYAEDCGVGRIFLDLEVNGKQERQGHLDTLISQHKMQDISEVKAKITRSKLLVRLNPMYEDTKDEVDQAINLGADLLMLPMFKNAKELGLFSKIVNKRVGIIPLVETYSAIQDMHNIVNVAGVSEIYIGLNDLYLDTGLKFIFEPLANGMIDKAVEIIKAVKIPFGFGGIARIGEGVIPGELILSEHLRLGSNSVILSRTFHNKGKTKADFKNNLDLQREMQRLFKKIEELKLRSENRIDEDREKFKNLVFHIVN
jgi:hypothetical protein